MRIQTAYSGCGGDMVHHLPKFFVNEIVHARRGRVDGGEDDSSNWISTKENVRGSVDENKNLQIHGELMSEVLESVSGIDLSCRR